ncbi:MAG: transporter [Desulfohalobiaceae bacterium]
MVAPLDMTMDMHMFGAMYGLTDSVTLMAMIPYIDKSMDHRTRMGVEFTTDARGFGDAKLTALFTMFDNGAHHVHLGAGLSLPTGSIDEKDDTPAGPDQQLPYPMQLGSGTFDLLPSLTYLGNSGGWSWGGQVMGTLRLGDNDRNYSLGEAIDITAWLARQLGPMLNASLRTKASFWGDIHGADEELNPMMVPTADPDRRSGGRVDLLAGLSLQGPSGPLQGHSLSLELGLPVYQKLDGPQMETDWTVIGGWRWMF